MEVVGVKVKAEAGRPGVNVRGRQDIDLIGLKQI